MLCAECMNISLFAMFLSSWQCCLWSIVSCSRFDTSVAFNLPDESTREEIASQYARHLSTSELKSLASVSDGWVHLDATHLLSAETKICFIDHTHCIELVPFHHAFVATSWMAMCLWYMYQHIASFSFRFTIPLFGSAYFTADKSIIWNCDQL